MLGRPVLGRPALGKDVVSSTGTRLPRVLLMAAGTAGLCAVVTPGPVTAVVARMTLPVSGRGRVLRRTVVRVPVPVPMTVSGTGGRRHGRPGHEQEEGDSQSSSAAMHGS